MFLRYVEVARIEPASKLMLMPGVYMALTQIGSVWTSVLFLIMVLVITENRAKTMFLAFLHPDRTSENRPWDVSQAYLRGCESGR